MAGTLYGIGVGPGDPELLTLKAARLIAAAPVVAYPANPRGDSQARTIAAAHISPTAEHLPLVMDFGIDRVQANAAYDAGTKVIAAHLAAGRDVALLCEGDPLLYGSFTYVLDRLPDDVSVEIVPGISALTACAAEARRILCQGDDPLLVLPATLDESALVAALMPVASVALFKVGRHLEKVARALAAAGMADDALCVIEAGRPTMRLVPLSDALASGQGVPYFTLLLSRRASPQ